MTAEVLSYLSSYIKTSTAFQKRNKLPTTKLGSSTVIVRVIEKKINFARTFTIKFL